MPKIPEALDQAEEKLERAEKTRVAEPNIEPKAEKEADSFGELREKDRRKQFWYVFVLAFFVCIILYVIFICDLLFGRTPLTWQMELMLVLPATTILLALITALRYKGNKDNELSENIIKSLPEIWIKIVKDTSFK
jgi:hypothetical protein